jgi:hypothetical protein
MSTQQEWQQRSDILNTAIMNAKEDIQYRLYQLDSPGTRQSNALKTLADLLGCLQQFACEQYNFFDNLFFGPESEINDQSCAKYPQEYVFSVIFDQISFDLAAITQAANQRLSRNENDLRTLEKADEITIRALQPVMESFHLQDTRIVTYFQKDTSIRVIPYAPVALIGIPYTVTTLGWDFLAIPHEIGHHIFWHGTLANGRTVQEELSQMVSKEPQWCYRWLEETFADVYGCLTAGPAIALSFQDLQMRSTPSRFVANDEDHPVPILRPNIYTKALEGNFGDWVERLNHRWNGNGTQNGKWRERTPDNEFKHRNGGRKDVIEAMTNVNEMVSQIVSFLGDKRGGKAVTWWHDYLQPESQVDTLYQAFDKHVDELTLTETSATLPDLAPHNFCALHKKWLAQGRELKDAPTWIPVLNAGGWTVKGPTCEGAGTCGGG